MDIVNDGMRILQFLLYLGLTYTHAFHLKDTIDTPHWKKGCYMRRKEIIILKSGEKNEE